MRLHLFGQISGDGVIHNVSLLLRGRQKVKAHEQKREEHEPDGTGTAVPTPRDCPAEKNQQYLIEWLSRSILVRLDTGRAPAFPVCCCSNIANCSILGEYLQPKNTLSFFASQTE